MEELTKLINEVHVTLQEFQHNVYQRLDSLEQRVCSVERLLNKKSRKRARSTKTSATKALPKVPQESVILLQSVIRGALVRADVRRKLRMNWKRDNIVREIVETEKNYVNNLKLIESVFLNPLRARATSGNPIISMQDIKALFGGIEVIIGINTMLLQMLEERYKNWDMRSKLGDIFVKMADSFKVYVGYVDNYDQAIATLKKCMAENSEFAAFVEACEQKPELKLNDLTSLLINPIQRLPRYKLLLNQLLENTWPEHVDYESIEAALDKIEKASEYVNNKKKEAESTRKLVEIQLKLIKCPEVIVTESRKWIAEQTLRETSRMREYHVVLFNDAILFSIPRKDGKLEFKHFCPIEIVSTKDTEEKLKFEIVAGNQHYYFIATDAKNKQFWIDSITTAKKDFCDLLQTSPNPEQFGTTRVKDFKKMVAKGRRSIYWKNTDDVTKLQKSLSMAIHNANSRRQSITSETASVSTSDTEASSDG